VSQRASCPLCHAPASWREMMQQRTRDVGPTWQPWQERQYTAYGFALKEAVAAGADYERRRPVRSATLQSDVAVPGLQALISGLAAGVCAGTGSALLQGPSPVIVGLSTAAGVAGLTWLGLMRVHLALLWEIEKITGVNLNRDNVLGEPPPEPQGPNLVQVEIKEKAGRIRRYVTVPLSDAELKRLAAAILTRRVEFSRRKLAAADALPGERYDEVLEAFNRGTLVRWKGKGPNSGVELTGAGRAFLRQYISE